MNVITQAMAIAAARERALNNPRALNSADMSVWGGELTDEEAQALWDTGIRNIKVGTGYNGPHGAGQWSVQQASTWLRLFGDNGGTVDAYIYLYMAGDAAAQCAQGVNTLGELKIRYWWLDAEDVDSPELSPAQRIAFLWECIRLMTSIEEPCGIYSGRWWWVPNMDNTPEFAAYLLWNSFYDEDPDEDGLPYGGWEHSAVEQYAGTTNVGGQSVDLDFDATLDTTDEEDGLSQAQYDALRVQIAQVARAAFAGGERPEGENRDEYALFRIGQIDKVGGEQSANDKAESALYMSLIGQGKISAGMTPEAVRAIVDEELANVRLVLAGA